MGLVLNGRQCFSHGQVYVAMSRVQTINGIKVFSPYTCNGGRNQIINVVYRELLNNVPPPTRQQWNQQELDGIETGTMEEQQNDPNQEEMIEVNENEMQMEIEDDEFHDYFD